MKIKFGDKFSTYYSNLLKSTNDSIEIENIVSSTTRLAQFNIISQGADNDFERASELTADERQSAQNLSYLGRISHKLGTLFKAKEFLMRSISIYEAIGNQDRVGDVYRTLAI